MCPVTARLDITNLSSLKSQVSINLRVNYVFTPNPVPRPVAVFIIVESAATIL